MSVGDIVREHWKTYGRNYYGRYVILVPLINTVLLINRTYDDSYDYEAVNATAANAMMINLGTVVAALAPGSVLAEGFTLAMADNFEYKDPVDNSVSSNQVSARTFIFLIQRLFHFIFKDSREP